jgi:hypothetical protein
LLVSLLVLCTAKPADTNKYQQPNSGLGMAGKLNLSDVAIRAAKPRAKPFKLTDGRGLHLLITPTGSRL